MLYSEKLETKDIVIIVNDLCDKFPSICKLSECELSLGKQLVVLDAEVLSKRLHHLISAGSFPGSTLVVLPGRSAKDLWLSMNKVWNLKLPYPALSVYAERRWGIEGKASVSVGNVPSREFLDLQTSNVIVLDDVVSSGDTIRKVHDQNHWKFPKAQWFSTSLLSRKKKVAGYKILVCSLFVEPYKGRRQPINSLSTLLDDVDMASKYAQKNFKDPRQFAYVLACIRGERNPCFG